MRPYPRSGCQLEDELTLHPIPIPNQVVGSQLENELILVHVLMAMLEALNGALRTTPDKRTLLDNFDTLMLTVDELIDGGCVPPATPEGPSCNPTGLGPGQGSSIAAASLSLSLRLSSSLSLRLRLRLRLSLS